MERLEQLRVSLLMVMLLLRLHKSNKVGHQLEDLIVDQLKDYLLMEMFLKEILKSLHKSNTKMAMQQVFHPMEMLLIRAQLRLKVTVQMEM